MKLQISFDLTNLSDAIDLAKKTSQFADVLEIGTSLIYKEGIKAIEEFKKEFPSKIILADAKICHDTKSAVEIFANAGADIITILAGTSNEKIYDGVQVAHSMGKKIALDLIDSYSTGQSAMDAEKLGVDFLLFIRSKETSFVDMSEEWNSTAGNTKLPIFISGAITKNNIKSLIKLNPHGITVGKAITESINPAKETEDFYSLVK